MELDEKACPVCAETIKAAAIKCRFCNADIKAIEAANVALVEDILYQGNPASVYSFWQIIPIVVTFGLAYFYYKARSLNISYEITTQRIKIEKGILFKVKQNVELFTIEHFEIESTLGMRFLGYCSLQLNSTDYKGQVLSIYGIEDLETLADKLREFSFKERGRRQVTSIIRT